MSDSRLEKFIYAICSMEVSDLPVPLSRIEKLWNCLITGETPDFEPLSRNEKYLMAMLDRYDISNLPAPMSRGEKLLYKIAVGETDLSDVPGYLSRYEELLKYLIENGGIGFEYVLYTLNQSLSTLYNTAEKPVKSAILKGQTLVNLCDMSKRIYKLDGNKNIWQKVLIDTNPSQLTVINYTDKIIHITLHNRTTDTWVSTTGVEPNSKFLVNCGSSNYLKDLYGAYSVGWSDTEEDRNILKDGILILEGDHTQEDIPYFEGMQSVKMPVLTTTGKNLFDVNKCKPNKTINNNGIESDSTLSTHYAYSEFIPISDIFTMSITSDNGSVPDNANGTRLRFYDENKKLIASRWFSTGINYNSARSRKYNTYSIDGAKYLKINFNASGGGADTTYEAIQTIQIEKGSKATSYEPYKSNILTTPEEVELRGIGDVKDELNVATGELTQRIDEVVFDGSEDENWDSYTGFGGLTYFRIAVNDIVQINDTDTTFMFDKIKVCRYSYLYNSTSIPEEMIGATTFSGTLKSQAIYIYYKNIGDVNTFKTYLQSNPITVQYQLAAPVIKTVDLTTVDQDGQPTKLKTYNDVTHVEIDATNIIPSVDVEVATKISETLSTMGLEHHDISEAQNKLSQTIDEQTENIDATMMATTEIYENL